MYTFRICSFIFVALIGAVMAQNLGDPIKIRYTIVNALTRDSTEFVACLTMNTTVKPFIDIMDEAAAIDPRFEYNGTTFAGLGVFINSINNVFEDVANEISWAIFSKQPICGQRCIRRIGHYRKIRGNRMCTLPVGVSSYLPSDNEHIVFSLQFWSIFNHVSACGGGTGHG